MVTRTTLGAHVVVVLVLVIVAAGAAAFDPTRYRVGRLRDIVGAAHRTDQPLVSRETPIRAKVQYTGQFRWLQDDSRRHIEVWAATFRVPEAPPLFRQEVKVVENEEEYWMPLKEILVPAMKAELRPGEEIEVFVIHIGHVMERQIFLINEFLHESHGDRDGLVGEQPERDPLLVPR